MADPLLEAAQVSFSYRSACVVDGVSFAVGSEEFVGIVGPNGSGKTTIARLMAGTLSPTLGAVLLGGRPVASYDPRERAGLLAYLPQDVVFPDAMSVIELVLLGRLSRQRGLSIAHRDDLLAARTALSSVGIEALENRFLAEVSGGERRRAFIAMVVAQGASTWVLDEPVTALDVRHAWEVFELMKRAPVAKIAVVHDFALAEAFCDRVVLMSHGCAVAVGPPAVALSEENLEAAYGISIERLLTASGRTAFVPRGSGMRA